MDKKISLLLISGCLTVVLLQGCAGVLVAGGAAGASVAGDRRTAGTFVEDQSIEIKAINSIFGDKELADKVAALYEDLPGPLFRTDLEIAEMVKYADNVWHGLKVTFGNEIGAICKRAGIDSHALMLAYQGDAQNHGAAVVFRSRVQGGSAGPEGIVLNVGGDEPMTICCRSVVNSAGLFAQDVARSIAGIPASSIPPQYFAKAHYFTLAGRPPFRRLVYPVASHAHLGVHVTVDMSGQIRFGPDVSWVDAVDYSFDHSRAPLFYEAIRKYYPGLKDGQLQPGYTGIRPKVSGPNEPAADFVVHGPLHHGVENARLLGWKGVVVESGPPEQIFTAPRTDRLKGFLSDVL
mgnify:CR=1 FL=1